MKNFVLLVFVSILGGIITLGSYKLFFTEEPILSENSNYSTNFIPTNYTSTNLTSGEPLDFTEAAENTVHAVVHVKNVAIHDQPQNITEFLYGIRGGKALQGTGSGVIITPDGYIVTNNHVIFNASEIEVTLNNNETYTAEVVGTDPISDIALIKIDVDNLDYVPFGNSNNVEIGEWVLAVGNPFNLTSTVTAGIISAKARDLNEFDNNVQSFIQTDAAINPGNSGGALVNTRGELVGINTAITSQTGSYVGYSFAVPSNIVRKVVEDIIEFGNVQKGILGITGGNIDSKIAKEQGLTDFQGVYVADVDRESGAGKAGIRAGDVIKRIDNVQIKKFSDLSGYINSKRPNDIVTVVYSRNNNEFEVEVKLEKYETYKIKSIGLEVANASEADLKKFNITHGVKITRSLNSSMRAENLEGIIITEIDNFKVKNVSDVERIMTSKNPNEPLAVTFAGPGGEKQRYIFR
ncbi:MAG TPA: trypsin-like peptidase domain-containing protein [Salinimicrobium sp.]|nr:trypsin-like peptidase domain-containing protein [Salinimicrobium sp.]